ncbi:hypothetical protein ITX44_39575 [Streptomyces sp. KK5PA1]|uniref:DUF5667 domain-containing protein n=2 Tax=Actinacidiphila acididurans TaxID=2784346 RepID=A0ABS2U7S8_9ACTN|nr:hypothetical protein [Actinacidiphila acididurans]
MAHRRANAFAQALEDAAVPGETTGEHSAGGTHPTAAAPTAGAPTGAHGAHAADRHADPGQPAMLALAAALSNRPRPVMDAEKKTVQRAQLIAAMEQALADGSFETARRLPQQRTEGGGSHRSRAGRLRGLGPRSKLSRRLAVGSLTVGVAAGAFGGVAAASSDALPGDTLYGLKRGMEDLKLDLATGDASRGKVYLDMAATRMQEARRLMDRGRGGPLDQESVGEVRKALSGMHQEASEGHRLLSHAYQEDGSLQPMELLNSFAQQHGESWRELRGKLPSQLTDVSDQVTSVFDAIDHEVAPLEPLLPKPKDSGTPGSRGGGSGPTGSGQGGGGGTGTTPTDATPSAPASDQSGQGGTQSPSPSPSAPSAPGLIGGSGDLLDPPSVSVPPVPGVTPTATPSASPTHHSVILPPLLPGLLPGLGLDDDPTGTAGQ